MAVDHQSGGDGPIDHLLDSAQFKRLTQEFEKATGLTLHAYGLTAVPQTVPFQPPSFCEALQAGVICPVYFDPGYHQTHRPEVRLTCAGLGHVVVPVLDANGRQLLNLVSSPVRIGPVDMEQVADLSFKLRIFPDDLAAQAEQAPLVLRGRLELAAEMLFAGLHQLAAEDGPQADTLALLSRHIAEADADDVPAAIASAALELTGAEFGYVVLLDDQGQRIAAGGQPHPTDIWPDRVAAGLIEWVLHAGEVVEVADVSESAWSRHLAGEGLPSATVVGAPLHANGTIVGGIVIGGGREAAKASVWRDALEALVESGGPALVMARRLVAGGGGSLVDQRTGAYNLRFLEELLEKEISRAGRHHHHLSLVVFHTANYADLLAALGGTGAEAALARLGDVLRSRVAQAEPLTVEVEGDARQVSITLQTRTLSDPGGVDAVLRSLEPHLN